MLVLMLVSPGVAAFADETSSTPVPVPVDVVDDPVVPEVVPPVEVPVEVEVPDVPADESVATQAVVSPSEEVLPVTVEAVAPVVVLTARSDFPAPITVGEGCELMTIATFWAGQNTDAGTVSVWHDDTNVYVEFETTGGWTMGLTHLYVGLSAPASYAPGSFPYQTAHDPQVTTYTYTISLASLGAVAGDTLYIAAHAEVHNGQSSETAWAGQGTWPGLLFTHVLEECEVQPVPADITVIKFNDLNENGELDEGEPYVEGVEITLASTESTDSAMTDIDGEVVFGPLYEGAYVIDEILPAGWFPTVELPIDVDLVEGQDQTVYIGNAEEPVVPVPADITVIKFNDLNENGELDEGEPYVEGVEITIEGAEEYSDSAMTDIDGEVVFGPLYEGTYVIDEILPAGWFPTVELPIEVDLVEGQDQTVYIGNAESFLPFTFIDLAIVKNASVSVASAGDIITYTLTYRNLGNTDAMNFVITDDFDERYVGIVDAAGGVVAGGEIMWSIPGPLGPEDGAKTITYSVRVINDMPEGITDIQNTVVISHPDDVNLSNNMDDATVRVNEPFLPFTPDQEDEEPFLPFTGGESNLLALLAGFAALAGLALRRVSHIS